MSGASPPTGGVSLLALQGEPNSFDELRELYNLTPEDLALFKKQLYDPIRHHKFPVDMAWIRLGCQVPPQLNRLNYNDVMHIFETCRRLAMMKDAELTVGQKCDMRRERIGEMRLLAGTEGKGDAEFNKDEYPVNSGVFVRYETTAEREVMLLEATKIATTAINNGRRSLLVTKSDEQLETMQTLPAPPSPVVQFNMNPQQPDVHRGRRPDIPLKTLCKLSRDVNWTPYAGDRLAFRRFEIGNNKLPSLRRMLFERKVMIRLAHNIKRNKLTKKNGNVTGLHKPFKLPISRAKPIPLKTPVRPLSAQRKLGGGRKKKKQRAGNEEVIKDPIASRTRSALKAQVSQQDKQTDAVPNDTQAGVERKDIANQVVQGEKPQDVVRKEPRKYIIQEGKPKETPQENKPGPMGVIQQSTNESKNVTSKIQQENVAISDKPKEPVLQESHKNSHKKGNIPDKFADKLAVLRNHANTIFSRERPPRPSPKPNNPPNDDEDKEEGEGGGVLLGDISITYKVTFNLSPTILEPVPLSIITAGNSYLDQTDWIDVPRAEPAAGVVEVPIEKIFPEHGRCYQLDMHELVKVATEISKANNSAKNMLTAGTQLTPPSGPKTPEKAPMLAPCIPTITLTPPEDVRRLGPISRRISEERRRRSRSRSRNRGIHRGADDAVILPPVQQMNGRVSRVLNSDTGECSWITVYEQPRHTTRWRG